VPYITIRGYLLGLAAKPGRLGRFNARLNAKFEQELTTYVMDKLQQLYGLTSLQLRKLAFELAAKNKIQHPFNVEKQCAGKDWLAGYLKRNPTVSFRTPEATSLSRPTGFNETEVKKFFTNLHSVMEKETFSADRIYNVDEAGISTVQRPGKILTAKGSKQVGKITSAERGQNVTVVCAMNAAGILDVPLAFIFPCKNMTTTLLKVHHTAALDTLYQVDGWTVKHLSSGCVTSSTMLRHLSPTKSY
jgi:hypothetical protein